MGARITLTAVFLALSVNLLYWLTLQPLLGRVLTALRVSDPDLALRMEGLLPALGGFLLLLSFGLGLLVLYVTVGLPLRRLSETVQMLSVQDGGLPLIGLGASLFESLTLALRRMATNILQERERAHDRIAELQKLNERLTRLQAELVSTDRLATVGKLAAGVAHEVGNPLSGVLGYLSVLRLKARDPARVVETCALIEVEVQRIDGIVRSLLELGRPSRHGASLVDVRPVLESCVGLLRSTPDLREVSVRVEAPTHLNAVCEPGPLAQVIINLLLNAAEAMGNRGTVVIQASELGVIDIIDEGPGLSPEAAGRLFELFFTTKPPGKGTGLGLAVSRHLLHQFGGTISGANRDDGARGARFRITLATSQGSTHSNPTL